MNLPALFKRYYLALNLLTLMIGVFFIAQIITFQIEKRLRVPLQPPFSPPEVVFQRPEPKALEVYAPIQDRNIFNLKPLPPPVSAAPPEPKVVVPVRLLGTVAGEETFAYAIIEDPYQKTQRIFRIKDTIAPGVQLIEVGRNKIVILRDGVREDIEPSLGDAPGFARAPSGAPPFGQVPPLPGVSQVSPQPDTFRMDKQEVEAASRDINRLMTQARLVPNFTGGAADGFRVFSIVPGSLYEKAGLRNGDIISNINGMELKDPEKAFQIYQILKDNESFTIDLVRAGQKMSLNYQLQ